VYNGAEETAADVIQEGHGIRQGPVMRASQRGTSGAIFFAYGAPDASAELARMNSFNFSLSRPMKPPGIFLVFPRIVLPRFVERLRLFVLRLGLARRHGSLVSPVTSLPVQAPRALFSISKCATGLMRVFEHPSR